MGQVVDVVTVRCHRREAEEIEAQMVEPAGRILLDEAVLAQGAQEPQDRGTIEAGRFREVLKAGAGSRSAGKRAKQGARPPHGLNPTLLLLLDRHRRSIAKIVPNYLSAKSR